MTNNIEIVNTTVALIIKAALLAARFSGTARKRNLKKLSKMDADEKDKEILFLRDKVDQQQMQITILQKGLQKKHTNKRYTLLEKLFILCYMETFQVARHKVSEHLGIARSMLYRWLRRIEEKSKAAMPVNKTPAEIAALEEKIILSLDFEFFIGVSAVQGYGWTPASYRQIHNKANLQPLNLQSFSFLLNPHNKYCRFIFHQFFPFMAGRFKSGRP